MKKMTRGPVIVLLMLFVLILCAGTSYALQASASASVLIFIPPRQENLQTTQAAPQAEEEPLTGQETVIADSGE